MDYLLTGSAGWLGSHILAELLREVLEQGKDSRIYLLVRPRGYQSALDRIRTLLNSADMPDYVKAYRKSQLFKPLRIIELDLDSPELAVRLKSLKTESLTVLHGADSITLAHPEVKRHEWKLPSQMATRNFVESLPYMKVSRLVYISSAYSCGIQPGTTEIRADYRELKVHKFRNLFEAHKNLMENYLEAFCRMHDMPLQIMRPSMLCGRLMDAPLYHASNYEMLYSWARYFFQNRRHIVRSKLRMYLHPRGTFNIVPVDYVAKVIIEAMHDPTIHSLNIVNPEPHLSNDVARVILERTGISDFKLMDRYPLRMNRWERLYSRTIGRVFEPYLAMENQSYNTTFLEQRFGHLSFDNSLLGLGNLISHAIEKGFEV